MKKNNKDLKSITPSSGYLLIKQEESSKKTESGIYLPESSDEKPQKGTVLAVGADEITDTGTKRVSPVKKGDTVIYKKWGGNEVKVDGEDLLFCKFEDILGVIK